MFAGKRSNPLTDLLRLVFRPQSVQSDSPTIAWIRQHPILTVTGLAYLLTWIGLIPLIRDPGIAAQATPSHAANPSVLVYVFLGVAGCLWAAVITAGAVGGLKGRYDLFRGYLKWRVGLQWVLAALLIPAAVLLAAAGINSLNLGQRLVFPTPALLPSEIVGPFVIMVLRYLIGNFEELCWRASVLPRLQAKYSALISSLMVGGIQGFWHLPFVFVKGHYVQSIGLPIFILQTIAMSVVATWLYNNTRGSLLMAALFHAAYDAASTFQGSDIRMFNLSIGLWCVLAISLIVLFGARHLSRKPDSEIAYAIIESEEKISGRPEPSAAD